MALFGDVLTAFAPQSYTLGIEGRGGQEDGNVLTAFAPQSFAFGRGFLLF